MCFSSYLELTVSADEEKLYPLSDFSKQIKHFPLWKQSFLPPLVRSAIKKWKCTQWISERLDPDQGLSRNVLKHKTKSKQSSIIRLSFDPPHSRRRDGEQKIGCMLKVMQGIRKLRVVIYVGGWSLFRPDSLFIIHRSELYGGVVSEQR